MRRAFTFFLICSASLLTACSEAPPHSDEETERVAGKVRDAEPASSDRASEIAVKTGASSQPLVIATKSPELDFRYVIPVEAASIALLRSLLVAKAERARTAAKDDYARFTNELPAGVTANRFSTEMAWKQVAATEQLLVFVAEGYVYTGGAHGSDVYETLIWDRAGERTLTISDLFTDEVAAMATIRQPFCTAMAQARARKLGREGTGSFVCPSFDEIALAPTRTVGGKFARIGAWIPAGVVGGTAEGHYTFNIFIPRAMIGLVAPRWRASFPG